MLVRGFADQPEKGRVLLLAVDDELSVENLVATVFRVDLRETEYLAIGQLTPYAPADVLQVGDLFFAERQPFLCVVSGDVVAVNYRIGLLADREYLLVDRMVFPLQHRVERGVFVLRFVEFLDPQDAVQAHVLRDFDGVGTPRRNHFAARADENTFEAFGPEVFGSAEKPLQPGYLFRRKFRRRLNGIYGIVFLEKQDHRYRV